MLDELGVASAEEELAQLLVLAKLRLDRFAHHTDLCALPIAAQFALAIAAYGAKFENAP